MTTLAASVLGAALAALGGVMIWRQRHATTSGELIRLVTTRYLGGKRFLTIVEVDGQRLLLGLSGDTVSLVTRLGRTDVEAPPAA
ncbi:MAG TPA: flagellar biosynthetic protein FliO [Candidatus Binatia bacterium]|jgi:flagellar biogenesis protein FliO|nr:flagellar biosynthetic protein FliO [Candidatus Binatia bacterium]